MPKRKGEWVPALTPKEVNIAESFVRWNGDKRKIVEDTGIRTSEVSLVLNKPLVLRKIAELKAEVAAHCPINRLDVLKNMMEIREWAWEKAKADDDLQSAKVALSATMEMGKCIGVDFYKPSLEEKASDDVLKMVELCNNVLQEIEDRNASVIQVKKKQECRDFLLRERHGEDYDPDKADAIYIVEEEEG